eukprot:1141431-Lingulodinium_polyedra.AAC.1
MLCLQHGEAKGSRLEPLRSPEGFVPGPSARFMGPRRAGPLARMGQGQGSSPAGLWRALQGRARCSSPVGRGPALRPRGPRPAPTVLPVGT